MTNANNKLIINTPVYHDGFEFSAHILLLPTQIDRVTEKALRGIDGYAEEETKAGALETWVGRFATEEIYEHGLGIRGWSANLNMVVEHLDRIGLDRLLPFVLPSTFGSFITSNYEDNPDVMDIENNFTPRAINFLLSKQIIE